MSAERVSGLFVSDAGGLGIVTDTDFRRKVVAGDVSPEAPITTIMSRPLLTVRADRFAADAALDMLYAGVEHLAVTDGRGAVVGLVSAKDLMGLAYWSPFALRAAIFNATSEAALDSATKELPQLFVTLVQAGLKATDIGRVLALNCDAVTTRLLDFAITRHGPAPRAWAWLALGSVARRELTLASDQDNALAYADPADPEVDAYFERVAQDVNAGLARAGFGADASGVLASNTEWRMSESLWVRTFQDCLEFARPFAPGQGCRFVRFPPSRWWVGGHAATGRRSQGSSRASGVPGPAGPNRHRRPSGITALVFCETMGAAAS